MAVIIMDYKFSSLSEAKIKLLELSKSNDIKTSKWSFYKILLHCAQTIEYSMKGYPELKPKILQLTIGKIAVNKFLKQGFMKHNLTTPVPGSPEISDNGDEKIAIEALISIIDKFIKYDAELYPHLLFGNLSKYKYDNYFAMHIADHLSEVTYKL
jgi:hypothetical protein